MSHHKLASALTELSLSRGWDEAKLEWDLVDVEWVDEEEECICGHNPIKEICTINNRYTNKSARVGNSCVKKFNNKSDKIFRVISKVKKDITKSVNAETIDFACGKTWITAKERDFYLDIFRKRVLTPKQEDWKRIINHKILSRIIR